MPSKKKKYNARFPAGRIKKIMQTDEEVGKVAQAVPVIISRTLELFVESLLTKTMQITLAKSAKTLSTSHMKQCILSESRFDFLKDLVKSLPDSAGGYDDDNVGGGGSASLSPASATPSVGFTGPCPTISSSPSEVLTVSPTLPLHSPQHSTPCPLPDRETSMKPEYNPRIHTMTSSVRGEMSRQNSIGRREMESIFPPGRVNPNFYTESPSSLGMNHSSDNHFSSVDLSTTTISNEPSPSPSSGLVVDEDYDT